MTRFLRSLRRALPPTPHDWPSGHAGCIISITHRHSSQVAEGYLYGVGMRFPTGGASGMVPTLNLSDVPRPESMNRALRTYELRNTRSMTCIEHHPDAVRIDADDWTRA